MTDESVPQIGAEAPGHEDLEGDVHETSEFQIPDQEQQAAIDQEKAEQNLLAGKYKSVQDLEQAYLEAQKKISQGNQAEPEQAPVQETDGDLQIQHGPFQGSVTEVLEAAGLEGKYIAAEWAAQGKLTEDMYESLSKLGWQRQIVDTFVQGQFATAAMEQNQQNSMKLDAIEMAGGNESFQNLYQWAARNYTEGQQDALNERLSSPQHYKGAIKEMMFDYQQATGTSTSKPLAQATEAGAPVAEGFKSVLEVKQAFAKARATGVLDEATQARIARTPQHLLEGVEG